MTAGYSGTPLVKKLGIKDGYKIRLVDPPDNYFDLLESLPKGVEVVEDGVKDIDFVHIFSSSKSEFETRLPEIKNWITQDGTIWASWRKGKATGQDHLDGNFIRKCALAIGLVDIKVCAVDETWSGLKLMIRKELRK